MKRTIASIAILAGSLPCAFHVYAAGQTLSGVVSDSMCMKKHMMPGKSDADCIRECVKAGSSYVLVVGDKSYVLKGKTAAIAQLAGKHVIVKGDINQGSITVDSIH